MNVLVTGGTGFVGRHLSRELVERGHDVTALARSPDEEALPDGVESAMGDVRAYESIENAFEGKDAVVHLVALSPLFEPKGGNEMHEKVHVQGTENVLDAAHEHGVERFVHMSALGADPEGPTAYIRAKGRAETAVRESDLDWVIMRPSVIFGEGGEFIRFTKRLVPPGVAPLPGGGRTRFQPIWVGDLVPILADALEDEEHVGETYDLGGPEVLSLRDIAKLVRNNVVILPVPMALAGVGLSVAGWVPGIPMGRDQYRSLRFDNTTETNESAEFGVSESEMRSLREYVEET